MSGHIQDLWFAPGPRGGKPRPTSRHGHGLRWKARYIDPDNRERSKSFTRKADAERFLTEVEHSKIAGSYLDPDAGRITLRKYVTATWLPNRTCDATTLESLRNRLNTHILPKLGDKRLDVLARSPSTVQAWVAGLPVGASYAGQILTVLSSVMSAAVDDGLIPRNPCRAGSVQAPRVVRRKVIPWTSEQVAAIRAVLTGCSDSPAVTTRFAAMVDCGAGLGMRQGEILGLAVEHVDFLKRTVHVRQQVRLIRAKPVFAPPKGQRERDVPLPHSVGLALAEHIRVYPPRAVSLPWRTLDGKPRTSALLFTGVRGGVVSRSALNTKVWQPARRAGGIPDSDAEGGGMHQLRHYYASALLAGGVDIRALSEYLGHHDPAFTLRIYAHLMPGSEERVRRAIEDALNAAAVVASYETSAVSSET